MSDVIRPTRRTLVCGAAWSVPAVAVAQAAPAFAASLCTKTAVLPVTWSSTPTTTSQTGTTSAGVNVNVTASYTSTLLGPGSINNANMATSNVAATRDSFSVVSNGPSTLSLDPSSNYQTVNFVFTRPVYALTFFLDDIDRGTGYFDYVGLAATPAETPTPTPGAQITGSGTFDNGWRTTSSGGGDNAAGQTVKVTYGDGTIGMTSLSLRFWSSIGPLLSSPTHLVRIRQMTFRACA